MIEIVTRALLTPAQTAGIVNITDRTLLRWRNDGVGPRWIDVGGGTVRYRAEDVDEWLRNRDAAA